MVNELIFCLNLYPCDIIILLEQLLKDLLDNPSKAQNDKVLKQVEETAQIVKELFSLVDEFDMLEGNVSYLDD